MARRAGGARRALAQGLRPVHQVSAGGLVYRERDGAPEVALIRVRSRWCLPKGQVESGERLEATALREVREETGLTGEIVGDLGDIRYWYTQRGDGQPKRVFKRVHFYLLRYLHGEVGDHDAEVDEVSWFPIELAGEKLAYASEKEVLRKAAEMIRKERARTQGVAPVEGS
jgi:8-oxo-dGTP pyrophosphatase MutT (NUDIX family)